MGKVWHCILRSVERLFVMAACTNCVIGSNTQCSFTRYDSSFVDERQDISNAIAIQFSHHIRPRSPQHILPGLRFSQNVHSRKAWPQEVARTTTTHFASLLALYQSFSSCISHVINTAQLLSPLSACMSGRGSPSRCNAACELKRAATGRSLPSSSGVHESLRDNVGTMCETARIAEAVHRRDLESNELILCYGRARPRMLVLIGPCRRADGPWAMWKMQAD
jgi:hypothetical protein